MTDKNEGVSRKDLRKNEICKEYQGTTGEGLCSKFKKNSPIGLN